MSVEQGDVIKSKAAESKLREQDILNTPEAQKMLAAMVEAEMNRREKAPTAQQPVLDVSSIVEAVVRGSAASNDTGIMPKTIRIEGNIPYTAADESLLKEPVSYKCNMVQYLLWPETVKGKLHNSPNGGAGVFQYAGMRNEGDNAVVESYFHTYDKNWIKFVEGHSSFGTNISKVGANSSTGAGQEVALAVKWFRMYSTKMHGELDREINVINASLPEDQHIPKGDMQTMRYNLSGYRAKLELAAVSKSLVTAEQAKEAALTAAQV